MPLPLPVSITHSLWHKQVNWIETISVVLPDENLVRNAYVITYFKSNYQLLCVQPEDGGGDAC